MNDNGPTNKSDLGPVTSIEVSRREHVRLRHMVRDLVTALSLLGEGHPLVRQLAAILQPPKDAPTSVLWGDLSRSWWSSAAERVGADERQTVMAAALESGLSMAQAARTAGYSEPCRKSGFVAARSTRVMQLRELAQAEKRRRGLWTG